MNADTELERRLRGGLGAWLDDETGPHPAWSGSPAQSRVADGAGGTARRPWRATRLLAVAAVLLVGLLGVAILASSRREPAVAECPTLADYAAASAAPSPAFDRAPDIAFPTVAPTASQTTGLQPLGTWVVVADEDGPKYQIRLRDPVPCDRLPDARSTHQGGSLVLAQADVQQLRPGGLGPWISMSDRFVVSFGEPPVGGHAPMHLFGVPGMVSWSSLSPRADFAQSSRVVFDVLPTETRVGAFLLDTATGLQLDAGWLLREGTGTYEIDRTRVPVPGPTATTGGPIPLDSEATLLDPSSGAPAVITVGGVDEVERYPAYAPPPGTVVVEAFVTGTAWSPGLDPAVDWPDTVPHGALRWQATDVEGNILHNLGDDSALSSTLDTISPLLPSDQTMHGYLAFEAPLDGPVRLALLRDGDEVAWWSLRD